MLLSTVVSLTLKFNKKPLILGFASWLSDSHGVENTVDFVGLLSCDQQAAALLYKMDEQFLPIDINYNKLLG